MYTKLVVCFNIILKYKIKRNQHRLYNNAIVCDTKQREINVDLVWTRLVNVLRSIC